VLPLAIVTYFIPASPKRSSQSKDQEETDRESEKEHPPLGKSLVILFSNLRYTFIVLGTGAYTFVVGALAFWVPEYLVDQLHMKLTSATFGVGVVTAFTGLFGTAFGGWLLDRIGGSTNSDGIARSMKLCVILSVIALPFAIGGFFLTKPLYFFLTLGVAEFLLFATQSPISCTILSVVPTNLRSLGMSMNIFGIHLLGDFPSPVFVGLLSDLTGSEQISMIILSCWLFWTILFYLATWILSIKEHRRLGKYNVEFKKVAQSNPDYDDE